MPRFHQSAASGMVLALLSLLCVLPVCGLHAAEWVWVEGEDATESSVTRHPWWYDKVETAHFSAGDFLSHFNDEKEGHAAYDVTLPAAGAYDFWVRANPVKSSLAYRINGGDWKDIPLRDAARGQVNVAADGKADLRFLAWCRVGRVDLKEGGNRIEFRLHGDHHNHGYIDCFVLHAGAFNPEGLRKPDDGAAPTDGDWVVWNPPGSIAAGSAVDMRFLNEPLAGSKGFIQTKAGSFVHEKTGEAVRFWAVNGPPSDLRDEGQMRQLARQLAAHGVNLVRLHGSVFDRRTGEPDMERIAWIQRVVHIMKQEGIYSHLSIYFPLWFTPGANLPWLRGYDGKTHPHAALFVNPGFQNRYKTWWKVLLGTPCPVTGVPLLEEPAVMGCELLNEDSLFFWTFNADRIPEPQMEMFERRFAEWVKGKHGSIENAYTHWASPPLPRDLPGEGRLAMRPLWNMANQRTARDRDTAAFLLDLQRSFYDTHYAFLRELGFRGVICAGNWKTASVEYFEPLENLSYMGGDFIDRHGYFTGEHKGEHAAWSIRKGHTWHDRSAFRLDDLAGAGSRSFSLPVMDMKYGDLPSTISETTWNRPNRFRYEAPLMYAAYGSLQNTGGIMHFALDSSTWAVQPRFHMQPWTLMTPAMMGQFPAAALLYRKGLVDTAPVVAEIRLNTRETRDLHGTPLVRGANLDVLRMADVPAGTPRTQDSRIDPLVHLVGQVRTTFVEEGSSWSLQGVEGRIDHDTKTVQSATGQVHLDFGRGILTAHAPQVEAVGGLFQAGEGEFKIGTLTFTTPMEMGVVIAVSLDGKPLADSSRILVQVMGEERASGFQASGHPPAPYRIEEVGHDPWQFRTLAGRVTLQRPDAATLHVTALDQTGHPRSRIGTAEGFDLLPDGVYYLISVE